MARTSGWSSRPRRRPRTRSSRWPKRCPRTARECCGCGSPRPRPVRSRSARCRSWGKGGPHARCAGCRWTRRATSAPGRTATGSAMPEPVSGRRAQRPDHPARPGRPPRGARASRKTVPAADGDGPVEDQAALELLTRGTLEVEGRLVEASNATLYCSISYQGTQAACVYKPVAGERPLWDFPPGTLAGREVAAYAVSQAAGWNLVPPTVMRDGPFGPGMCQLWIDADTGTDLVALARSREQPKLRDMAVFDAVVNNADRKIGHLLPVA